MKILTLKLAQKRYLKRLANVDFSRVGDGHTLSAIEALNINEKRFSHISLGGGL